MLDRQRWRLADFEPGHGTQVGVDVQVGRQLETGRFHQDLDLARRARSVRGVADDPAHGVGDLTDGSVDLIARAPCVKG